MDVLEALSATIRSAINLRVITLVGDAPVTGSIDNPQVAMPAKSVSMVTNINLIEGDVSTVLSEPFLGSDYAELRQLHGTMVDKGHAIIERNVAVLRELLADLAGKTLPEPPERRAKTAGAAGPPASGDAGPDR